MNNSKKIYLGYNSIKNLSKVLYDLKAKEIFLVCGKNSFTKSGAESVINSLQSKFNFSRFSDFSPNPKIEDVQKGCDLFNKKKFDVILSIGGGSSIDISKLIKGLSGTIEEKVNSVIVNKSDPKNIPLITVPTTLGSGSESTHFAVVYVDKKKYSLSHNLLLPNYVILDPSLSLSNSRYNKASAGMDALCQAIESLWSVNSTTESRSYSKEAIILLREYLVESVNSPNKLNTLKVAEASNLAGRAINIAKTTAPHALSYLFAEKLGISHGHAVSLTMPYFIRYNSAYETHETKLLLEKESLKMHMQTLYNCFGVNSSLDCSKKFISICNDLKLQNVLHKIKSKEMLKNLVDNLNIERAKNNPVLIDKEHLIFSIYE